MQHEQRVNRAYLREIGFGFAVYLVLIVAAIRLGRPMEDSPVRTLFLASPMLGFGLMIWAMARHVARLDEYVRQRVLEVIALSAAITAAVSFSYGFLETAGFPRLSMFSVWMVMGGSAALITLWRCLAKR